MKEISSTKKLNQPINELRLNKNTPKLTHLSHPTKWRNSILTSTNTNESCFSYYVPNESSMQLHAMKDQAAWIITSTIFTTSTIVHVEPSEIKRKALLVIKWTKTPKKRYLNCKTKMQKIPSNARTNMVAQQLFSSLQNDGRRGNNGRRRNC